MNPILRRIIRILLILVVILLVSYLGYKAYHFAIETYNAAIAHATSQIKQGVTEGVDEGVSGGIVKFLNPFGIFRGRS
ncbi:MAG: hypothetical protein P4L31_08310 [Candidatus Babeliales bacterium]|nr:hypothetical protein [Candidatus Babeliales bacterium]